MSSLSDGFSPGQRLTPKQENMAVNDLPLVEELTPGVDCGAALRAFAQWPNLVLFDSARAGVPAGRYAFLTADPFQFEVLPQAHFAALGSKAGRTSLDPLVGLER